MRKLVVCGASWMTAITGDDRHQHFTEKVARHFGAEYLNLAHPGVDNVSICLQIEQALKENTDTIFIRLKKTSILLITVHCIQTCGKPKG